MFSDFTSSLWAGYESQIAGWFQVSLRILLILIAAWFLRRFALRGVQYFSKYAFRGIRSEDEQKRFITLTRVLNYIINLLIFIIGGMLVLNELNISIAPILTAAGVLGIAVGFGAQSLIKDYFSGFFLLIENQLRHGDVVEISGKAGLVEEVTLRYVRLRDYEGRVHFVPNGQISHVTNLTRDYSYAVLRVSIAYRENVDQACEIIRNTCNELRQDRDFESLILEDVEIAGLDQWADSAIIILIRIKVRPIQQWTIRREILRRLKIAFDEIGIEIPYPHLTIYSGQNKDGTAPAFPLFYQNQNQEKKGNKE